tara:strand:- start:3590 stop:4018 length:429 start_codon:yes stop_codon:yes gene_type:complete
MNILLANDHAGTSLKNEIKDFLENKGYSVINLGCDTEESVDYPDFAHPLAEQVSNNNKLKGIIICGSGIGVSMSANKHKGVRSALCWNQETAKLSRSHNDANVLSLPARFLNKAEAIKIVDIFINTEFEGGRHNRRVDKINI